MKSFGYLEDQENPEAVLVMVKEDARMKKGGTEHVRMQRDFHGMDYVLRMDVYKDIEANTRETGRKYISLFLDSIEEEIVKDYRRKDEAMGRQTLPSMVSMPVFKKFLWSIKITF